MKRLVYATPAHARLARKIGAARRREEKTMKTNAKTKTTSATTTRVETGDRVSFVAKGATHVGVVGRIRTKQRLRAQRLLAGLAPHLVEETDLTVRVAEIVVDASKGYWTVPVHNLTIVAKRSTPPMQLPEAHNQLRAVKQGIKQAKRERAARRIESAALDLWSLREGAAIEVQFRDVGWQPATFVGVMKSGLVRYSRHGRLRSTPGSFIRLPRPVD